MTTFCAERNRSIAAIFYVTKRKANVYRSIYKTLFIYAMLVSFIVATSAGAATTIADKPSVTVTDITGSTATLSVNLGFANRPSSTSYHFEYIEARMICPMIYPPIPACVPKK